MNEKSSENEHAEDDTFDGFPADVPPEIDEQADEIAAIAAERVTNARERRRAHITSDLGGVIAAASAENLEPHEIAYRVLRRLEFSHGFAPVIPGAPSAEERAAMQQPVDSFISHEVILQKLLDRAKIEHGTLLAEIQRLRTRDARIPSLDQLDALLAKCHGEPIDLLGAIQTAEARAEAAREHPDPSVRRILLLDCAAWALAAVCEIDGAQTIAPVVVQREASDEGGGP